MHYNKNSGMSTIFYDDIPLFLFFYNMFSSVPAGLPIGIVKAVYTDAFTGGDVDELIFS